MSQLRRPRHKQQKSYQNSQCFIRDSNWVPPEHKTDSLLPCYKLLDIYEGRLQISWIHLATPSRNFVGMQWRFLFRSTSLGKRCTSYNAPPTTRKQAVDRWSFRNFLLQSSLFMVGKAQKSHGARSGLNSVFGLKKVDQWNPIRTSAIQSKSLGFSNLEKGAPRQEISKWSTICSTISRSGWSIVWSASLTNGGTSKRRPLLHVHNVPTRSNKVSPRNFQTALVLALITTLKVMSWTYLPSC
jgi:hypothetical protein